MCREKKEESVDGLCGAIKKVIKERKKRKTKICAIMSRDKMEQNNEQDRERKKQKLMNCDAEDKSRLAENDKRTKAAS